jgi:phosphoglycerol transferase
LFFAAQGMLVLILAAWAVRLAGYDLRVPLNYQGDTLWFTSLVKGLITHGWAFGNPDLSAPYTLDTVAFPSISSFDWVVMKALSLFYRDAAVVLNCFWLLSLVLTAWTASVAFLLLRAHPWVAFAAGVAYALLPFALLRNVTHISLVYYTVPLLGLLVINIAMGGFGDERDRDVRFAGYAGALVQGFNYLYFSFFAAGLLVFAGVVSLARDRKIRMLRTMAVALAILIVASTVNLAPSFISWAQQGKPPDLEYKRPAEAEAYALKLRRMLAPSEWNPVPVLAAWGKRDVTTPYPSENENRTARLGLLGSLGLIVMFGTTMFLVRYRDEEVTSIARAASAAGLATFLVSTVGGLGAVFNLLVVPDIRAYNRFSVFLAFFAFVPLVLLVTGFATGAPRRRIAALALFVAIACASVFDQLLDAAGIAARQGADQAAASNERALVQRMESTFAPGAAVFEFPLTQFPADAGTGRMRAYDHARPYLWSTGLRWSWPSFSQRHAAWQRALPLQAGKDLVDALVLSGFAAIWVDRYGLQDPDAVTASFTQAGAPLLFEDPSRRYAVFDLRARAAALEKTLGGEAFAQARRRILETPAIQWGPQFYAMERRAGTGAEVRWSMAASELTVRNYMDADAVIAIALSVYAQKPGTVTVLGGDGPVELKAGPDEPRTTFDLTVPARGTRRLVLVGHVERVIVPTDPRELYFAVVSPQVSMNISREEPAKP